MSLAHSNNVHRPDDFTRQAEDSSPGLVREIWDLLRYNKKWWLMPVLVMLLLTGLFVMLSGTVFAPFIYPLF
jgi:hypothetical protein